MREWRELDLPTIGIIGVGVVGGALKSYLEGGGITPLLYDRFLRLGSRKEVDQADLIFVCVPTPYQPGGGFDHSAIADAIAPLSGQKTVVIKSTVVPGTTEAYQRRYPQHTLLFNPEFLVEKTANEDFLKPDRQIVGYCGASLGEARSVLQLLPRAPHEALMPARAAELVKYATNSFLALKVIFSNEIFDLCETLGASYEDVRRSVAADERIGSSHMDVLDGGYRGYGGKCLPKDTMALMDLAESLGAPLRLLEAAHEINLRLRAPMAADLGVIVQPRRWTNRGSGSRAA
jgi:UDPglucose 6-dehydrogenase